MTAYSRTWILYVFACSVVYVRFYSASRSVTVLRLMFKQCWLIWENTVSNILQVQIPGEPMEPPKDSQKWTKFTRLKVYRSWYDTVSSKCDYCIAYRIINSVIEWSELFAKKNTRLDRAVAKIFFYRGEGIAWVWGPHGRERDGGFGEGQPAPLKPATGSGGTP